MSGCWHRFRAGPGSLPFICKLGWRPMLMMWGEREARWPHSYFLPTSLLHQPSHGNHLLVLPTGVSLTACEQGMGSLGWEHHEAAQHASHVWVSSSFQQSLSRPPLMLLPHVGTPGATNTDTSCALSPPVACTRLCSDPLYHTIPPTDPRARVRYQ